MKVTFDSIAQPVMLINNAVAVEISVHRIPSEPHTGRSSVHQEISAVLKSSSRYHGNTTKFDSYQVLHLADE